MKKRLKMTITTVRRQTIASAADALRLACPVCKREVEMVTNAQAISILGIDHQTLGHLVAAGQVHTVQAVSGNIRICKDSLFPRKE